MTPMHDHELHKSCLGMDCDWKHKCDLYQRPRSTMHFNPPETGAFCHSYVPRFTPYGEGADGEAND